MESDSRKKSSAAMLFHKNQLMAERHFLLVKLAECANKIKRIDEQLESI